ncbi:MAG: carbohydrate binding domain-containing protein [Phycisphaeraceae bacterium]|nr:carbohydrate binding domain-containing protein [Phycisphaeraceae bacterium]
MQTWLIRIVLAGLLCATAYGEESNNLLTNPGFEDATASGGLRAWSVNTTYPVESIDLVRSDPVRVRSGSASVKLAQTGIDANARELFGAIYTQSDIPVEPLVEYRLSFWVRGSGKVSGTIYGYGEQGNVYEQAPIVRLVKLGDDGPDSFFRIGDGDPWTLCQYQFCVTSRESKTTSVRVAINAHGTVYIDDCRFERVGPMTESAGKTAEITKEDKSIAAAEQPSELRPNLVSLVRVAAPPVIDGRIDDGEYPLRVEGLVDCSNQSMYPQNHTWRMTYDSTHLYFALHLKLPHGCAFAPVGAGRDDSALIAASDAFYCYLRTDADTAAKRYEGVYLAVDSAGNFYDAWETIDHVHLQCQRQAEFNANWKIATSRSQDQWTIEWSVPWQDMKLPAPEPGREYALSFGLNVNNQRLAWQSHPTWFDYPQAFGLIRLAGNTLAVQAPNLDGLRRGELNAGLQLNNPTGHDIPYDLTYVVSKVRMTEGSIGSWVLDQVGDLRQREAVAADSLYSRRQSGFVPRNGNDNMAGQSRLRQPGYYVLELEARSSGVSCYYQKIPFHYYPPIILSLEPIPSKDQILAHLGLHGAELKAGAKVSLNFVNEQGQNLLSQQAEVAADVVDMTLSMASLKPGSYQVQAALTDAAGGEIAQCTETFRKWDTPVWEKERAGIEALEGDWVPSPWSPLEIRGSDVAVWGRTFSFAPGSLLAKMTSQDKPLLAAGMSASYQKQGKAQDIQIADPTMQTQQKGRAVVVQQGRSPDFDLTSRAMVEFDGLLRYDITVTPRGKPAIDELCIRIPFHDMKYANGANGSAWQTGLVDELNFRQTGRWYLFWLGDERRGCGFVVENHKGWLINSKKPRIVLDKEDGRRVLKLFIVNDAAEVNQPLSFTFALHPTPVKPMFAGWRDLRPHGLGYGQPPINLNMIHAWGWNSSDSKPSPRSWQVLTDMLTYLHGRQQRVYPYLGTYYLTPHHFIRVETPFIPEGGKHPDNMLVERKKDAGRLEEYFYFKKDWDLSPPVIHEVGMETQEEVRISSAASYADYFAHGIGEMLKRSDVDGIYCDIPLPSQDFNAELGLSYTTMDGVTEGTYSVFAARDLYKRMYCLFEKYRGEAKKPYILGHGLPMMPAITSFWDMTFHGEELKPAEAYGCTKMFLQTRAAASPLAVPDDTDEHRTYDAHYFRSMFCAYGGNPVILLPQYGYQPRLGNMPEHSREILSFTFLHDTLLWPADIPPQTVYDFWNKVEIPFGMGDAAFHPYWENGARCEPACIKLSYWRKPDGMDVLVAVANWSGQKVDASISLPDELKTLAQGVDMESGEAVQLSGAWNVSVPAHNLRVFRFNQPQTPAKP